MMTTPRKRATKLEPVASPPEAPEEVSVETPPSTLSDAARKWWRTIVTTFELEEWHILLLNEAAHSWDRAQEARRIVDRDGPVTYDRWNQAKEHPATRIERDSMAAFLKCWRELDIDNSGPELDVRPARITRNR
jgi:phage terminase small subunit